MLTIPKNTRLQCAADDAYVIGETIEALGTLLDRFYEKHGEEIGSQLTRLLPQCPADIGAPAAKTIYSFAHSLEPTEDRP